MIRSNSIIMEGAICRLFVLICLCLSSSKAQDLGGLIGNILGGGGGGRSLDSQQGLLGAVNNIRLKAVQFEAYKTKL